MSPWWCWPCRRWLRRRRRPIRLSMCRSSSATRGGQPGDYGDVDYADPGFQLDGKKRYPIDTVGHIRAAWRYINQPRNAARYCDEQLGRIKAAIIAAWKRKIDANGPPAAPAP